MNFKSTKDITLARNCGLVQIRNLKKKQSNTSEKDLIEFSKFVNAINASNFFEAESMLHNTSTPIFKEFSDNFQTKSPKEFADYHINLVKKMLSEESNPYSRKKFEDFKKAFYKGNEELNDKTTNLDELEEEPEFNTSSNIPNILQKIKNNIISFKSSNISPESFKEFCKEFSNDVFVFANDKFKETFDYAGYNMTDMNIEYSFNDDLRSVYSAKFSVLDKTTNEKSEKLFQKPVTFINNYFQNLCHAYLESKKFAEKSISALKLLTIDKINEIIDSFYADLKNLIEMAKCKIQLAIQEKNITYMFFLVITEHTPQLSDANVENWNKTTDGEEYEL